MKSRLVLIKTEEQFINEFGEFWREKVRHGFPNDMDYMLGKTVRITKWGNNSRREVWKTEHSLHRFRSISKNMIHSDKLIQQNMKKHGFTSRG
jgi:hypothetical protein